MPTLEEVLQLLAPTPLCLNIELKNSMVDYPGLEQACVDLVARYGMTDRVLYSSFNHFSLQVVKDIDASLPCGILYEALTLNPWGYAADSGFDALHPHHSSLRLPFFCRKAHDKGLQVNPWTLNTEAHLNRAIKAGADILITNYPDLAQKCLAAAK